MTKSNEKFYSYKDGAEVFLELINATLYSTKIYKCSNVRELAQAVRLTATAHDMYCPHCRMEATFRAVHHNNAVKLKEEQNIADARRAVGGVVKGFSPSSIDWTSEFTLLLSCTRKGHRANFYFISTYQPIDSGDPEKLQDYSWSVVKVGQYPSAVDFHRNDIQKFKSVLTDDQIGDMKRALNTSAHGFHVAACVYYRRVFEGLINTAKVEHMNKFGWTEWPEYNSVSTDQRIALLAEELPEFMTQHPHLYKILSKGVHELTENECAVELPILKESIELILDEQLLVKQRKAQAVRVSSLLSQSMNRTSQQ